MRTLFRSTFAGNLRHRSWTIGPTRSYAAAQHAFAQLKVWNILRKLRCCPDKTTRLVKATGVLQDRERQAAAAAGRKVSLQRLSYYYAKQFMNRSH